MENLASNTQNDLGLCRIRLKALLMQVRAFITQKTVLILHCIQNFQNLQNQFQNLQVLPKLLAKVCKHLNAFLLKSGYAGASALPPVYTQFVYSLPRASNSFTPFYSYGEWRAFVETWYDEAEPLHDSLTFTGVRANKTPHQADFDWCAPTVWRSELVY